MRVSLLLFHPFLRRSQVNRTLYRSVHDLPGVHARDLYSLYPEFSIDVEREQAELEQADLIVFQHPFYWYNCPSLMKEWIDAVFERGWAYGPGGDKLKGKYWLQVISTGGQEDMYHREGNNRFTICELLRPFEQTARLCGMTPLDPFLVHGSFGLSEVDRTALGDRYRKMLGDLVEGKIPGEYSTSECAEIAAAVRAKSI